MFIFIESFFFQLSNIFELSIFNSFIKIVRYDLLKEDKKDLQLDTVQKKITAPDGSCKEDSN